MHPVLKQGIVNWDAFIRSSSRDDFEESVFCIFSVKLCFLFNVIHFYASPFYTSGP